MDYGFAPGFTPFDREGQVLLESRPNTILIHSFDPIHVKLILNVQAFIKKLVDGGLFITKPVGDLIILTHGNDDAWMQIDLDSTSKERDGQTDAKHTRFNVLKQAVTSKSVQIPDTLHEDPPNPPVEFDVHIRGCCVGKLELFVRKLKEAFKSATVVNAPRFVTAPKHAHYVAPKPYEITSIPDRRVHKGTYENLAYVFEVLRPSAKRFVKTSTQTAKEQAMDAFDKGWVFKDGEEFQPFTFIKEEGPIGVEERVPNEVWDKMIPDNLRSKKSWRWVKLGVDLGNNIGRQIDELELEYEFEHRDNYALDKKLTWMFTMKDITQDPVNDALKDELFRERISNNEHFKQSSENPIPVYRELGYRDVESFLDGYTWHFSKWRSNTQDYDCNGTRDIYTIYMPIVEPGGPHKDELLFNFYPFKDSGLIKHEGLHPLVDERLFLKV